MTNKTFALLSIAALAFLTGCSSQDGNKIAADLKKKRMLRNWSERLRNRKLQPLKRLTGSSWLNEMASLTRSIQKYRFQGMLLPPTPTARK